MKAEEFLRELEEYSRVEKCKACECLLGALVQLRLDYPGYKRDVERLSSDIKPRGCLGCTPCPPGEAWTRYLKGDKSKVNQ